MNMFLSIIISRVNLNNFNIKMFGIVLIVLGILKVI